MLEGGGGLGAPTQRELRTLGEHNLDSTRFRLPCLCTLQGDVTFGRSANALGAARDLATGEAEVESHRRLNLTVCEVRFFVRSSLPLPSSFLKNIVPGFYPGSRRFTNP